MQQEAVLTAKQSSIHTQHSNNTNNAANLLRRLDRLAHNLYWTWNQECLEVFQELSPRGWQDLYHNAVAILRDISEYEFSIRLQDSAFAERICEILENFENYLAAKDTWVAHNAPLLLKHPVA